MKTLYLDCSMGAAGDMISASLLELTDDPSRIVSALNCIGIPHVEYILEHVTKLGVKGTRLAVKVHGEEEFGHSGGGHEHHSSGSMKSIEHIAEDLNVSEKVRGDIMSVYSLIAEAESRVHGVPVSEVHFHEVGALDAVADIAATAMLMEMLAPDEVIASSVRTGSGHIACAHGLLPVPAPATVILLTGIPAYSGDIASEMCTPTGAALIKYYADSFGEMPVMRISAVGYGMGKRDFEKLNAVRAFLGEREHHGTDRVAVLSCNIDDMTAEEMAFACERLSESGALDVFTQSIGMKKGRPGTMLSVICGANEKLRMAELMFLYTTTIGIRVSETDRFVLSRDNVVKKTDLGSVRVKKSSGYGVHREKLEYEDLARIAVQNNISITQLRDMICKEI